jgi:hypothetical protein
MTIADDEDRFHNPEIITVPTMAMRELWRLETTEPVSGVHFLQ